MTTAHAPSHVDAALLLREHGHQVDQVIDVDVDAILFVSDGVAMTAWVKRNQHTDKTTVNVEAGFQAWPASA
jgi:hypothetical protein